MSSNLRPPEMSHTDLLQYWTQGRVSYNSATAADSEVDTSDETDDMAAWQFRQISVSDDVICGITLIGDHMRWVELSFDESRK